MVDSSPCLKETTKSNSLSLGNRATVNTVTPVPSSDAAEPLSSQQENDQESSIVAAKVAAFATLPSPVTPAEVVEHQARQATKEAPKPAPVAGSSPSRKVWGIISIHNAFFSRLSCFACNKSFDWNAD